MKRLAEFRPQQVRTTDVLVAAVTSRRTHHAYLLVGPAESDAEGLAWSMAWSLVCTNRQGADPCGVCSGCQKHQARTHPDVVSISPDEKKKISIDTVRSLSRRMALCAIEAPTKVAIISEADALNHAAQNALLKTLEEPPGATCFFLTTARVRTLLPTVRSRCQTLRLAPLERRGAFHALAAEGIDTGLARHLAALAGPDAERAKALLAQGAEDVIHGIRTILRPNVPCSEVLNLAADLATKPERVQLALSILEVEVRDRLAARFSVAPDYLYTTTAGTESIDLSVAELSATARCLQQTRRTRALNTNACMTLENVLLTLTGNISPTHPAVGPAKRMA